MPSTRARRPQALLAEAEELERLAARLEQALRPVEPPVEFAQRLAQQLAVRAAQSAGPVARLAQRRWWAIAAAIGVIASVAGVIAYLWRRRAHSRAPAAA